MGQLGNTALLNQMRGVGGENGITQILNDTGAYRVETLKATSQVESFTTALKKQDVTFKQLRKSGALLNEVTKEQYRISKMSTAAWSVDARNRVTADMIIPRDVPARLTSVTKSFAEARAGAASWGTVIGEQRMRLGVFSESLKSASTNLINSGKNMQWGGRQLMVGMTLPFLAIGAAAGKAYYDVDQSLTKIARVYDFNDKADATQAEKAAARANLRAQSLATARKAAEDYGASIKDTLDAEGELAAAGQTGRQLQENTISVQRASMLGQMDYNKTVDTTIALQTVFHHSSAQIADDFNYMNSMENSTVLTMKDFTEALPRVAGLLEPLGGSLQDIGTMLTAMKAASVPATQGANALKSALGSMLKPTAGAKAALKEYNISLKEITDSNGGNLLPSLTELAKKMDNAKVSAQGQATVMFALFGKQQAARINAIVTGLRQVTDETTQVGRAAKIAKDGTVEWSKTASGELLTYQQSASYKFKKTLEVMKAELASAGKPFLELATTALGAVERIMNGFNSMSDFKKKVLMIGAGFIAIIPPIIMAVGLFRNFMGQMMSLYAGSLKLASGFKVVGAEEKLQQVIAKQSQSIFADENMQLRQMSIALETAAQGFRDLATSQKASAEAALMSTPGYARAATLMQTKNGGMVVRQNNRFSKVTPADLALGKEIAHTEALAENVRRTSAETTVLATNTDKVAKGFGRASGAAAGTAGMIGLMIGGTNKWIMGISTALLLYGSLNVAAKTQAALGALSTANAVAQRAGLAAMIPTATKVGALVAGSAGYAGGFTKSLIGAINPIGAILVAVGALAAAMLYIKHLGDQQVENYKKLGGVAKGAADALGVTYNDSGVGANDNAKVAKQLTLQDSIKKNYGAQLDLMSNMNKSQATAQAKQIGLEFYLATGDNGRANEVMKALLAASGKGDISKNIKVNFTTDSDAVLVDTLKGKINDIGSADYGKTTWEKINGNKGDHWYSNSDNALTGESKAEGQRQGKALAQALNKALAAGDVTGANELIAKVQTVFEDKISSVTKGIVAKMKDKDKIKFEQLFKFSPDDSRKLADLILKQGGVKKLQDAGFGNLVDNGGLKQTLTGYRNYIQSTAESGSVSKETAKKIADLNGIIKELPAGQVAAANAIDQTGAAAAAAGSKISWLADEMAHSEQDAVTWGTEALKTSWGTIMDNAKDMYVQAHTDAMDAMTKRQKVASDALDKEGTLRDKKFDTAGKTLTDKYKKLSDGVTKTYKKRTDAVDAAIKAEQAAEAMRQKIFAAEQARIQRQAEMFSTSVDVNMALNSGNMDEAAKLISNARATQSGWAEQDASANSADGSAARVEALNAKKDVLSKSEAAEQDALNKSKDKADALLAHQKDVYDQDLAARKKALDDRNAAEQKAADRSFAIDQKNLDSELAAIRAYVPKNITEQQAQVNQLEAVYKKHNMFLNTKSNEWSAMVGKSMADASNAAKAAVANDNEWKEIATKAANDITGAFGMSKDEFMAWVTTGKLPTAAQKAQGQLASDGKNWLLPNGHKIAMPYHTGGRVGFDKGGRNGVSNANSRMPSEVDTRLRVGEYVVNRGAVDAYGTDFMEAINSRRVPKNIGGGQALGPAGFIGAAVVGVMKSLIRRQFENAGVSQAAKDSQAQGFEAAPGMPGNYGNVPLNATQMANAATIMATGRGMGASDRDLIVSLMTAMQESNLTNIAGGDRDSVGLFQQRPSQGWGTVAQIMDPKYSSTQFFTHLLGIKDRDKMQLTEEAQAVQRSAFPDAYAKWEAMARSIVAGGSGAGNVPDNWQAGTGKGLSLPLNGRVTSRFGMRTNPVTGKYVLHNGTDLAAPIGTPIHAAASGQVLRAGPASGYGNWTVLGHPGGLETGYAHQRNIVVNAGDAVKRGQVIGYVGMTGNTTGPHLHFQTGMNGNWSNPNAFIPGLKVGGDVVHEGIARLHEKETVLTAPLSKSLKSGIEKIDSGAGTTYNVTMDLRGAFIKEDLDIENALDKALAKKEGRLGVKRKIT